MPKQQVHGRFKVFCGAIAADGGLGKLADEVAAFTANGKVAPKSVGVEYLEGAKALVLTLGYRDDEAGYPVVVTTKSLGHVEKLDADSMKHLEDRMAKAAAEVGNVICHELFVTENNDFTMVFMAHKA